MRMLSHEQVPLLKVVVFLIAGIVVENWLHAEWPLLPILALSVAVTCLLWRRPQLQSLCIFGCFFLLGMMLTQRARPIEEQKQVLHTQHTTTRLERSKTYFMGWREQLLKRLHDSGVTGEQYAVVAAMALGDRRAMTSELRERYSMTGAAHVLALSGLHMGIIYALLSLLITRRRKRIATQVVLILSIWLFVLLTGMSVSVVRAAVMFTVYALMALGNRDRMSVNVLAFTALVMLMVNPYDLFDVSFQLSFMAMLSILLFVPLAEMLFPEGYLMMHRGVRWLWGIVGVSTAAQLGVAPLIAYYFGRFSTGFLLTNFVVFIAAPLILYLTLLVLVVPSLSFLLNIAVDCQNTSLGWISHLPLISIEGLHPTILQTAMIYVIIAACYLLMRKLVTYIQASATHRSGWPPPIAE